MIVRDATVTELRPYQKNGWLIFGSLCAVAFFALAVATLIHDPSPDSVFHILRSPISFYPITIVGFILFAGITIFALNSLRNPKPRVIPSGRGIAVDGFSGKFNAGWEQFSGYTFDGKSIYALQRRDAKAFIEQQPAGRPRETARVLSDRFGSPFLIEAAQLAEDPENIRSFLVKHLQELKT